MRREKEKGRGGGGGALPQSQPTREHAQCQKGHCRRANRPVNTPGIKRDLPPPSPLSAPPEHPTRVTLAAPVVPLLRTRNLPASESPVRVRNSQLLVHEHVAPFPSNACAAARAPAHEQRPVGVPEPETQLVRQVRSCVLRVGSVL